MLEHTKNQPINQLCNEKIKADIILVCKGGILFFFPTLAGNYILNRIHTTEELKSVLKGCFLYSVMTSIEIIGVLDIVKCCVSFYNSATVSLLYKTTAAVMSSCILNTINAIIITSTTGGNLQKETTTALIGTTISWFCLMIMAAIKRQVGLNMTCCKHKEKVETTEHMKSGQTQTHIQTEELVKDLEYGETDVSLVF